MESKFRCYSWAHWAAVTTHWLLIRVPPQKYLPWLVEMWIAATKGNWPVTTVLPPMTRAPKQRVFRAIILINTKFTIPRCGEYAQVKAKAQAQMKSRDFIIFAFE